jgi:putative transposase
MEPGQIYHVFNHANGWENLFTEQRNYHFFLEKMDRFLSPTIDIYAHCLMPNHFHLAVGIPELKELIKRNIDFDGLNEEDAGKKISKQFSNLYNSYTQSFNNYYERMGSLFIPNMKVKEINDVASFCKVVHYIHANPVHHGFTYNIQDWPYSSFNSLISKVGHCKESQFVLNAFGGYEQFLKYHKQPITVRINGFKEELKWLKSTNENF